MSPVILFYVTVPSVKVGQNIAKELLDKRLIACANILPAHNAIYKWEGELKNESEHIMIIKTHRQHQLPVETQIKVLHPYDCPCILTLRSSQANPEFAQWIESQVL
ncbi:MAG: divalent-cation tolerance protein CutA [Bdellovibrionales bacterium]|nr:divalent-cation tolerance protein CutA [Bdellovibrionales bacterium]NQZ20115.1 divalent-cation tolerance protein CutA [Bdellovibrionales bacterium]